MNNINKYILFIVFIILNITTFSQNNINNRLSKEKYQEDFDYYCKIMAEVNPQVELKKRVEGLDILKKLDSIKKEINEISCNADFYNLICKATDICQDNHLSTCLPYETVSELSIDTSVILLNYYYDIEYQKKLINTTSMSQELKYYKGKYFFFTPINLYSDNFENIYTIPIGTQCVEINYIPIDHLVSVSKAWDKQNQKYFSKLFYMGGSNSYKILTPERESKIIEANKYSWSSNNSSNESTLCKVNYFDECKILFIRIPEMKYDYISFFQKELAKMKNKEIDKVVIDIRLNRGGNDSVWYMVLSSIIADTMCFNTSLLLRNTDLTKYYSKIYISLEDNDILKCNIPYFDTNYFFEIHTKRMIIPSTNSLNYNGKIYICYDDISYSSSLAFVSAANTQANKFITIGEYTGVIGGRAATPFIFMLPNSKITFRMNCMLDGTDVRELYDLYQDRPTYVMEIDPYEYSRMRLTEKERYTYKFMRKYDSMFKKVLEQE